MRPDELKELGRLAGVVEGVSRQITELSVDLKAKVDDHEVRLRSHEIFRNRVYGAWGVIMMCLGFLGVKIGG